jgi:chemotaxis family two-component system sensor kinase Cph1
MTSTLAAVQDCKTAALQYLSDVQANGALVAIHGESHLIEYCSANVKEFLGVGPEQLLGKTGAEGLGAVWPQLSTLAKGEGRLEWCELADGDPLVVIGHKQGEHRIFEFERRKGSERKEFERPEGVERAKNSQRHWWNHSARTRFVEELTGAHTVERCRELLVDWVFERSGYDRVMLYLFRSDWNGEVVRERCRPGVEGFLGLRFPAADIPPNARQMFALNLQRAIVDVDAEPSPIRRWMEGGQALDLTYSTLRSAHPVHLQYLKNMGVQASLTLSVVVNAKLRGMIACHHLSARELSIEDRLAFEEIARIVALHLTNVLGLLEQRSRSEMRQRLSQLRGALSAAGDDTKLALSNNLGMVREAFAAGGAWLRFEGEDLFVGRVPDKLSLAPMRDYLELLPREQLSHFGVLPESLRSYRALVVNASGVLFIPLGSVDFIALVRPEVIETVNWAGKPAVAEEPAVVAVQTLGQTLGPRNSFAVWSEQVRHTSEPWSDTQLEFGERLRLDVEHFLGTARLEHIALHDPLTGLANRLLFERRLQAEVRNSMTHNNIFAVHIIDLDRFKQVNDTYGHGAGDQVLTEVARRLLEVVAPSDTVARLGGDEFAIIQAGLEDSARAVALAERIVQTISESYRVTENTVEIGVSIGVSSYPSDTVEESELLENADLALYHVKNSGRNAYSLYAPTMRSAESHDREGELLSSAIQNDEFRLMYQPIVDARSGDLRGLEAFLRWQRPGAREQAAGEFMALAEQRRLGPEIGEWVMDEVFRQYRQWLREGLPMVPITVNIANSEFASRDLLGQIERLGAQYETGWQWLRLDIKEAAVVADAGHSIRKLSKLREAGVGTNLDNFGSSFIPLGYLTQLPFRGIKLDAMLLDEKNSRQRRDALFNVVQSIAQVFSAQLIVTRVETQEMREALQHERIDFLQGYAIARPAHAAEAAAWLGRPESMTQEELEIPVGPVGWRVERPRGD